MGKIYGYIRVSSKDQNEERQLIAMREKNIPPKNIFIDKKSGKDFERPAFLRLLKRLRQNDILYIKSIDRLGRNYGEVMEMWRVITKEKKSDIIVLDMPLLDTTNSKDLLGTFISDIVLQLLSFVAENERDNIRARQAEGIAAAKLRGVQFGRPKKYLPQNFNELYRAWKSGERSDLETAALCGLSRSTFYKKVKEYKQEGRLKTMP